jgi:hypothetical protein
MRSFLFISHAYFYACAVADNSDEEAEAGADLKLIRAARSAREYAAVDLKSTRTARREATRSAREYAALDMEATRAARSVKDVIRDERSAREYAAEKRAEAERLMRVADLATYKAVKFTNEAELISAIEKARSLGCDNAENFSSDITEKLPTDEASTSNPSSQMRTSPSSP